MFFGKMLTFKSKLNIGAGQKAAKVKKGIHVHTLILQFQTLAETKQLHSSSGKNTDNIIKDVINCS